MSDLEKRVAELEDAVAGLAKALKATHTLGGDNNIINRLVVNEITEGFPVHMHLSSGRRAERIQIIEESERQS